MLHIVIRPCFFTEDVLQVEWRYFVTKAFEEEVKTPENSIYLVDNPVALQYSQDALQKLLSRIKTLAEISGFLGPSLSCFTIDWGSGLK